MADDAEFALIPEVRGLGKKCLEDWAKHQVNEQEAKAREMKLRQHSKKLNWHITFGIVGMEERCFLQAGKLIRPLARLITQKHASEIAKLKKKCRVKKQSLSVK
ncbi:hypothetical protein DB42_BS00020 [Neochlamydia sp. EPS4]|nr:hypothetical protein DB42_BS00020 [Neochlamydia sp. EPS4]